MNLALVIIFLIVTIGVFAFAIYKAVGLVKNKIPSAINYPNEIKKILYLVGAVAVANILLFIFIAMNNAYPMTKGEWTELVFGSLICGVCFPSFILAFIIHYYCKELPKKLDKILYICMILSAICTILGLILLTNSFADYLSYPLKNALSFVDGFVSPDGTKHKGSIAFYALFILSGAIICYFVADHKFYKEYGKHGILESTLYVAFPAGIIGARIGYVIGNWNVVSEGSKSFAQRCADGEWWCIFAIWEGGLTILAGALIGIAVGVLWFKTRKKQYSLCLAMDSIIPAILIAQAIGRWGNFFNCEVYGFDVYASDWQILPKIILNNMQYSQNGYFNVQPGMIHLPLFLIEGIINLAGYYVIRYGVGELLKRYAEPCDQAASYLIWYGLTRVLLEPLRNADFNMGEKGYWSWFWSFFFIIGGALGIAINHIVRYLISKKNNTYILQKNSFKNGLIATSAFTVVALALIITGAVLMSTNEYVSILSYNDFSNGMLLLFIGISVLLMNGVTIPYVIEGKRNNAK